MEYAEKLIADKEQDKTIFDNSQRNLIVNFAYKLDDRAATEELASNLAAAVAAENTEEVNRLMWEAEEKIENLPDGMIGLSEMHEYGYLKDDVLPLTKEGAREWHRLGERIYPLFQDGTAGDFASQEEIEQHDGIFGIKADAWSAILLEKNEEYLEDEYARPDAALTVISREQALRLFDKGKQIYLIRISPWPVLVTGREEIERGSDYFQIAKEDLEKDKQKAMENSEIAPVEKLAADLDDFAFDFDFYHYKDSVEDREQAVEALKEQIQAGDVQPIREWLQDAVEESEGESAEKAAELITRLDALVKEQKLLSGSEKQFGMGYILAYTLNYNNHDGRYSHSNKEWADTTCKGERGSNIRTDWIVRSHPAVLNGFVDMYRKELAAEQQREPEKPFVQQFYVVTNLHTNPMQIEKFGNLDDAMSCYQQVPNFHLKALGVEKTPDPLPGSLDIVQCKNGIDTIVEDYKKVPGWDNPYIQNHVVALVAEALKVQDVAVAYEINDGYFYIQTSEDGYNYTLYNKDFTVMDGGIIEVDGYRPVQEMMEEVLAEHGHSVSECGVISIAYLQEQSYRAETQRAEAMKEKLAAEKPAPEANISFYVAECAEFPVMGEFHDNLTLEQALEIYDKIPAERMDGIKSIGFSLEDGSIYSGMFDLMVGGEVQAEVVNHIQHYRESPLVQKAISDMKTLLEKRQASKELEERPNTRQSVREALKNRKKAQEQQPHQEQAKPKKAKKKGEMEL